MPPTPRFRGPLSYRLRCAEVVARSVSIATARRLRRGPRMPGWNWTVELGTAVIRNELKAAFSHPDIADQRRFLDSFVLTSPALDQVIRKEIPGKHICGTWFLPKNPSSTTLLYLHGGGFAFYPKESYANLIALITLAANTSTFALDYRLTPEHRFPAQIDDARAAYLWLLSQRIEPQRLVVAGDSAGGNLTLALLCDLRNRGLPLPALGIALSPATEFDAIRPSYAANEYSDWITSAMALTWRDWYCRPEQRSHPLVSPIHADLRGLPPLYIQAGQAEILYDSISAFALAAHAQGARLTCDSWPNMNHVFQFFGHDAPQSSQALHRIAEVVAVNSPA